ARGAGRVEELREERVGLLHGFDRGVVKHDWTRVLPGPLVHEHRVAAHRDGEIDLVTGFLGRRQFPHAGQRYIGLYRAEQETLEVLEGLLRIHDAVAAAVTPVDVRAVRTVHVGGANLHETVALRSGGETRGAHAHVVVGGIRTDGAEH